MLTASQAADIGERAGILHQSGEASRMWPGGPSGVTPAVLLAAIDTSKEPLARAVGAAASRRSSCLKTSRPQKMSSGRPANLSHARWTPDCTARLPNNRVCAWIRHKWPLALWRVGSRLWESPDMPGRCTRARAALMPSRPAGVSAPNWAARPKSPQPQRNTAAPKYSWSNPSPWGTPDDRTTWWVSCSISPATPRRSSLDRSSGSRRADHGRVALLLQRLPGVACAWRPAYRGVPLTDP